MRILTCFSILIVAAVSCDTLSSVDIESEAKTQNDVERSDYSRANEEDDSSDSYSAPAHEVRSNKGVRTEFNRKPHSTYKTNPVVRTVLEEDGPVVYKRRTYSVPKSVARGYSTHAVRTFNDNDDDYIDQEGRPVEYQPEEYPAAPIGPPYTPPVRVYSSIPVVRRGYRLPIYRRPTYARVLSIGSPAYRTVEYDIPPTYSVQPVRSFAPLSRFRTISSTIPFDHGIAPIEVSGFIEGEYDDILKKKKK